MRQATEEAEGQHPVIARRQRAQEIAEREDAHQPDQQRPARNPGRQHRDQRGTDDDTKRVDADDMPCGRLVDAEPGREIGQQAHRGEFGGADGESAHGEREQHEPDRDGPGGRHGGVQAAIMRGERHGEGFRKKGQPQCCTATSDSHDSRATAMAEDGERHDTGAYRAFRLACRVGPR